MSAPGDERDPADERERSESGAGSGRDDADRAPGRPASRGDPPTRQSEGTPGVDTRDPGGPDTSGGVPSTREEWRSDDDTHGPTPRGNTAGETSSWRLFAYDVLSSVLAVLVVGAYLFAVSGVWPPLVAVESESMVPNMQVNDLVFVMEADRFPGPDAQSDSGVVTARAGRAADYRKFGGYGDVVVYERDGDGQRVPIIHRAMFWVEAGENWYDRADPAHVGTATACGDTTNEGLRNCPAPHGGFITLGDNNNRYDQASGLSEPVRPGWVVGTAEVRVPGLGWIRLQSQAGAASATGPGVGPANATGPGVGPANATG
jgi:signal peptidase